MGRIIDKILILFLTIVIIAQAVSGTTRLIAIYMSVAVSALNYYLITKDRSDYGTELSDVKEKIAFTLEIVSMLVIIMFPATAAAVPNVMYDSMKSRNYIAMGMGVIAVILLYPYTTFYLYLFTILLIFMAIYLSIKSEKASILSRNYHRLRDDSSEKSERLLSQNLSLEKAKEDEIYTAQLSERNRIAREIHDNVGHMLSRALLQTGAMLAIHKEEPVHSELADLRSTLDTAMNNIRSSVHDLHDESIDLNAGIEQMTELLRNSGRFKVNVDIDTDRNMPRDIKYAILGIAKECITNIHKHSRNPEVDIKIIEHPSMYQIVIYDYDPEAFGRQSTGSGEQEAPDIYTDGIGLANIRSRVDSLGGKLSITTDDGFKVFVTIPIN